MTQKNFEVPKDEDESGRTRLSLMMIMKKKRHSFLESFSTVSFFIPTAAHCPKEASDPAKQKAKEAAIVASTPSFPLPRCRLPCSPPKSET